MDLVRRRPSLVLSLRYWVPPVPEPAVLYGSMEAVGGRGRTLTILHAVVVDNWPRHPQNAGSKRRTRCFADPGGVSQGRHQLLVITLTILRQSRFDMGSSDISSNHVFHMQQAWQCPRVYCAGIGSPRARTSTVAPRTRCTPFRV